jgi:hypothetical protein
LRWAAAILDVWLALWHCPRTWLGRPVRLRDLWRALPGDLMGLMVMRGCGIAAPTRQVQAGDVRAVLVEDPRVRRWFRIHLMPVRAQTVGCYIFARERVSVEILAHECEHIRQWERFGPFFLMVYLGSSAMAFLRGRRPYWDNRFEAAARSRADREMAALRDAGQPPRAIQSASRH